MKEPLIALVAVLCNVGAQLAMKNGGRAGPATELASWLSPWLVGAVVLYGASFLLTVRVYAANLLSVASPVMAGGSFLLVTLASAFLLDERMDAARLGGIALILCGIIVLTRS